MRDTGKLTPEQKKAIGKKMDKILDAAGIEEEPMPPEGERTATFVVAPLLRGPRRLKPEDLEPGRPGSGGG